MIDNLNPTNQFHPYIPETSQPAVERLEAARSRGPAAMLDKVRNMASSGSMGDRVTAFRNYARTNPAQVLGGLAAFVIGAGLMRRRMSQP